MKTATSGLDEHLASGTTTLCRCWRLVRRDGAVFGFTDHDQVLSFADTFYDPASGFAASQLQSSLGLAVDTMEVDGALSSDRITDADIALGRWDGTDVEIWLVNWKKPAERMLVRRGTLGEVTRGEIAYRAEIRSLAHLLNQDQGRCYQRDCDTVLGTARCGIDLALPVHCGEGAVLSVIDDRLLTVSGLTGHEEATFSHGVLAWTGGGNSGANAEIREHAISALDGSITLTLWQRAALAVSAGDTFTLTAGCDRSFAMCSSRFDNAVNFQGFPHMPGIDFSLAYARRSKVNDGGSLFHD